MGTVLKSQAYFRKISVIQRNWEILKFQCDTSRSWCDYIDWPFPETHCPTHETHAMGRIFPKKQSNAGGSTRWSPALNTSHYIFDRGIRFPTSARANN